MKNKIVSIVFFFVGVVSTFAQEEFEDDVEDLPPANLESNELVWMIIMFIIMFVFYTTTRKSKIENRKVNQV